MEISFKILTYTEADSLWEYIKLQKKPEQVQEKVAPKKELLNFKRVFGVSIILFSALIVLFSSTLPQPLVGIFGTLIVISMGLLWISFQVKSMSFEKEEDRWNFYFPTKTERTYKYFGEMIHFLSNKISITSPIKKRNFSFLYSEIQSFVIHYQSEVTVFKVEYLNEIREYTTSSKKQKSSFIQVLEYLYALNIPINEMDELGRKLHLLELVDKPKAEIDEKYQRLIDEIGEKE